MDQLRLRHGCACTRSAVISPGFQAEVESSPFPLSSGLCRTGAHSAAQCVMLTCMTQPLCPPTTADPHPCHFTFSTAKFVDKQTHSAALAGGRVFADLWWSCTKMAMLVLQQWCLFVGLVKNTSKPLGVFKSPRITPPLCKPISIPRPPPFADTLNPPLQTKTPCIPIFKGRGHVRDP